MGSYEEDYNQWIHGQHRERPVLNTSIMFTAILSLLFVIIIVVLIHIYVRCVVKRQARRRQAVLQLGIHSATTNTNPPRTGLDPSVISSLPIFIYKRAAGADAEDPAATVVECAVCLSTIEEEETVRLLPNCKHTFHAQCIDLWLNGHSTCPVCRTEAEPIETAPAEEGTSEPPEKVGGSRLSSFRRMLSRERSGGRRVQPCELQRDQGVVVRDLERQ